MLRSAEIDFDAQTTRVEFLDGKVAHGPGPPLPRPGFVIRRSRMDFARRLLFLSLDDDTLELDIGTPGQAMPAGVPVVYLDQLHWVGVAQSLSTPHRLRRDDREAAAALLALAQDRRIILPVAAAHLSEMGPVTGRRRRDLAMAILRLCRGWQMKNPVRIRIDEYAAAIRREDPVASNVFTLDPGVLFVDGPTLPTPMSGLPGWLADMTARAIAVSAVYSAVLNDEALDMSEGKATATRWAGGFPPLASYMRERRMGEEHARINARARLISDQRGELDRAARQSGVTPEQFASWLSKEFLDDHVRMPSVGRFAEVLYLRLRNADDKWEGNDLNDMNFLCAAAGYADITVGEKKTIGYLRRSEGRVRPGSQLCRRLSEAVESLASIGITP